MSIGACDLCLSFLHKGGLSQLTLRQQIGCGRWTRTTVLLVMGQAGYLLPHSALSRLHLNIASACAETMQTISLSASVSFGSKGGRSGPLLAYPIISPTTPPCQYLALHGFSSTQDLLILHAQHPHFPRAHLNSSSALFFIANCYSGTCFGGDEYKAFGLFLYPF